jgi:hypothetical protein
MKHVKFAKNKELFKFKFKFSWPQKNRLFPISAGLISANVIELSHCRRYVKKINNEGKNIQKKNSLFIFIQLMKSFSWP